MSSNGGMNAARQRFMRWLLVVLAGATALGVGPSAARADSMPAFTWTGFYLGGNVGYGWGSGAVHYSSGNAASAAIFNAGLAPTLVSTKPNGLIGGGQAGFNLQWQHWVAGLEADFDLSDVEGTGSTHGPIFFIGSGFLDSAAKRVESLGTLRARFGYAVDRTLFYATGGMAYGQTELNTSFVFVGACAPVGLCAATNSSQWMVGWTVGGGVEWALAPAWSVKGEYLHYDLGSHGQSQFDPASPAPVPLILSSTTFRGDIVRIGLNYRFGH